MTCHDITLHYIPLHYTTLHDMTLHYITLHAYTQTVTSRYITFHCNILNASLKMVIRINLPHDHHLSIVFSSFL